MEQTVPSRSTLPIKRSPKDLWATVQRKTTKKQNLRSIALQVREKSQTVPRITSQGHQIHDLETPLLPTYEEGKRVGTYSSYGSAIEAPFKPHHTLDYPRGLPFWTSFRKFLCNEKTIILSVTYLLLFGLGAIFFYILHNPTWTFLPRNASVSWWLLFILRLSVTLNLSQLTQHLIVQAVNEDDINRRRIRKRNMVHRNGSEYLNMWVLWMKFLVRQSLGWPFMCILWGFWTILLMYGNHRFAKNWLFFLHWPLLSPEHNSDHGILGDKFYLRSILSLILCGLLAVLKRMLFALYLGRRMFHHFFPHIRALTENIQLISELAEFSNEDLSDFHTIEDTAASKSSCALDSSATDPVDDYNETFQYSTNPIVYTGSDTIEYPESDSDNSSDEPTELKPFPSSSRLQRHHTSAFYELRNKLDRWKEPHVGEINDPSFQDIFHLHEALSTMDDPHPFTASFGLADTRDNCIKSAMDVYQNLLRFTPLEFEVPFETIAALAYEFDQSGSYLLNERKLRSIRALFRPDKKDYLTMVAFTQSADVTFKKLLFLRASMANSIRIDLVLENIMNPVFFTTLLFIVLTILQYDTRTLLVTVSTVVLSIAFVIGSTLSKYVEGIFFIAVRRPFDIGDRISIVSATDAGMDTGSLDTWIVEDIDLMTTTLRLSSSNEVSTVDNYAIASSRIINYARSPNALVNIKIKFMLPTSQSQVDEFIGKVRLYVKERPRTWQNVVYFRQIRVNGWLEYNLKLQHVKSWQEKSLILTDRTETVKYCIDEATRMGIIYSENV